MKAPKLEKFAKGDIDDALKECPDIIKRYVRDLKKRVNFQKEQTIHYMRKFRQEKYGGER